jgi:hypothetical protein
MVVMVDDGSEKIKVMNDGSLLPLLLPPCWWFRKKTPKTFFRLGAPFLSEFKFFIQKEEMFEF